MTIDKSFQRQKAKNSYNSGAKIGEVHASNRSFPKGMRENQFLNIEDATILDDIHSTMSLEQTASFILNAAKEESMGQDDMQMRAATIASSLESCWQGIGRRTPQKIEDFLAQVKKQAPSHRPRQQAFIDLIASFSKSENGIPSHGFSSEDAVVICDDDSSNCDVMAMLVGKEAAFEYGRGLQEAEDLGGYGADGGRGDNSAEGRQREGMMAHMKMISNCGQNERFSNAISEESKRLSRIDPNHIQGLAAEIQEAPRFVRGEHSLSDCNLCDDFLTPDDISLKSVYSPLSGFCFVDSNNLYKVVGVVKGPYQTDGDIFENNLIALHLGSAKNVRKYLSRKESLTPVMGRLNGVAVEGVSYPRMMLVTPEMSRYEVFVNFDPMPGEENLYFTHVNGMLAEGQNEWRPREFSCLEYVDWNTSK